jgi:SAM-dependent methyltransferase
MSMSSLTGKHILSLIRDGDFAHPGETAAIDLVLDGLPRGAARRVLDLGCGLGATAALVAERGYGDVWGVDIDAETIAYAERTYPGPSFVCASATGVSRALRGPFDTILMFTSFYAFPDRDTVLRECLALAHPGTELRIFDYATPTWSAEARQFCHGYARGRHWQPLVLDGIEDEFGRNGWRVTSCRDLTNEFRQWYRELISNIEARRDRVVEASDEHWSAYAHQRYAELLAAIEQGPIGGAMVCAMPAQ